MGHHSQRMHVKKAERQILLAYLLNEGVLAVKKENIGKHEQTKLDNLKVLMVLKSLHSRGFVDHTFSWQHNYYTVTSEGIEFLRKELGIENEKVYPKTHQPKKRAEPQQLERGEGGDRRQMTRGRGGFRGGRGGDRGGWRGGDR